MAEEDISQEFRLKNIGKTINYFIKEVDQNELIINKHKKVFITLNFIERFLVLDLQLLDVFRFLLLLL